MKDGYVRVERWDKWCNRYFMTEDTYWALAKSSLLASALEVLDQFGPGTHLIPPRCLAPEEARDSSQR
jgi:hypothetical protein